MKEKLLSLILELEVLRAKFEVAINQLPNDDVIVVPDPQPEPEPEPDLDPPIKACKKGPTIEGISKITATSAEVLFDAIDVHEIKYWISKEENGTSISGGILYPTSSRIPFSFPKLANGAYYLNIEGNDCKSPVSSRKFTIQVEDASSGSGNGGTTTPPPVTPPPTQTDNKRKIIMNATGSGFDVDDPTGIRETIRKQADAYCNLEYKGQKFRGIDYLQLSSRWLDYEPTEGDFTRGDKQMLAAQKWCKDRGLGLCIEFVMWRKTGDGMFSDDHKETLSNGEIWTSNPILNRDIYMPSLSSDIAREKISKTLQHLASVLSRDPSAAYYIAITTAQTGEYQAIVQERPQLISGFSRADKDKWASFSGGKNMPNSGQTANDDALGNYMGTPDGKKYYEFRTAMLREFHAVCMRAIRKGGMKAAAMYAGVGAPTAVHNFTYKINEIFSAGTSDQPDVIYSSEGDAGSQWRKLVAADLNLGTFPGATISMEFDHDDVSWTQERNPPQNTPINPGIVYDYGRSFFARGGKDLHLAMDYLPSVIPGFAEPFWKFRTETYDPLPKAETVVFPITRYSGGQEYIDMWQGRGGGLNKQVLIVLK